jgi:translocator protein
MKKNIAITAIRLIISVIVPLAIGALGAVFTAPAVNGWYAGLEKPAFTPPNWLFGPVWTTLYVLMGVAFFLVWQRAAENRTARIGMGLFGVQLGLNFLWSYLFFGRQSPLAGLVDILLLWAAIAATMIYFYRVSRPAGLLMVPYILWVTLALALNFEIWRLNM